MKLLKDAEAAATQLIEDHLPGVRLLIHELEARETLGFPDIEACLSPDKKVRPLNPPDAGNQPESNGG